MTSCRPVARGLADEAPLGLLAVLRGTTWLTTDGDSPVELAPGAILVSRGPDPCTISDPPGLPPQVVVLPRRPPACGTAAALRVKTVTS